MPAEAEVYSTRAEIFHERRLLERTAHGRAVARAGEKFAREPTLAPHRRRLRQGNE